MLTMFSKSKKYEAKKEEKPADPKQVKIEFKKPKKLISYENSERKVEMKR